MPVLRMRTHANREKIFIAANKIQNKLDMKYEQLKNDHILMDRQVGALFHRAQPCINGIVA